MKDISEALDAAVKRLEQEYGNLQIGRASSGLVENMMIDSYGAMQPIKNVASISIPDAMSVQIQPWDKSMLPAIEKAISDSDLNMNPTNNGVSIILNIPPLTEDRRRDLVKVVGRLAEEAKISVRNAHHEKLASLKREEHDKEITEDDKNRGEKQVQEKVETANAKIVELAKKKEESIMTV